MPLPLMRRTDMHPAKRESRPAVHNPRPAVHDPQPAVHDPCNAVHALAVPLYTLPYAPLPSSGPSFTSSKGSIFVGSKEKVGREEEEEPGPARDSSEEGLRPGAPPCSVIK